MSDGWMILATQHMGEGWSPSHDPDDFPCEIEPEYMRENGIWYWRYRRRGF